MKWEYLKVPYIDASSKAFNILGDQNWELVHMYSIDENKGIAYFKRPLRQTVVHGPTIDYKIDEEKLREFENKLRDALQPITDKIKKTVNG